MSTAKYSFTEIKEVFIELYGEIYDSESFDNFDSAFKSAWESFDYISNAQDKYEFAEGMTQCSQLQEK